jgi:hypothetical protein
MNIFGDDPQFINPAQNNFRLKTISPCIDTGMTSDGLKADFDGIQRSLKAVEQLRGDGSGTDVGAFEFIPTPVAVWLPNGGPDLIRPGDVLNVAWRLSPTSAGTTLNLELDNDFTSLVGVGQVGSGSGSGQTQVRLPVWLSTGSAYSIRATSVLHPAYFASTPLFSVLHYNAVLPPQWLYYE